MKTQLFSILIPLCLLVQCATEKQISNTYEADIIIYGGTSAAVASAVQAKRMNLSVLIVSPDKHLGGLSSSGLGFTDTGNKEVIGGISREFYQRIYNYYQQDSTWKWQERSEYGNKGQGTPAIDGDKRTMWIFEPKIAEQVFEDFIEESTVTVYRDEWLDRENGVVKEGASIVSITTLSGKTFKGKIFIDATYEGDLMAASEVSYHIGRESNSVYDETWNGIQKGVFHHGHYFEDKIDPYIIPGDSTSGLLAKISPEPPGTNGDGDHRIQAYCFRMCLSNHPDNRIPFPKPANYDPKNYELLKRIYEKGWDATFRKYDPIPNRKTDTNNHGPFSTDNIGMNYDYPEATYERRKDIIKEHEDYQKGLLYFMANDPSIPEDVHNAMQKWGLAADEFLDNGNWPHQIYVREARRMLGTHVMTEHEILGTKPVVQPIGMGSYNIDSHNTQRYITEEGYVQNEGDIGVHPKNPYQISLGSILPKPDECNNLLVPVCVSSSHIAFGSIRMEPVFMILGQSAATLAGLSINKKIPPINVPFELLKDQLENDGQILSYDSK